MPDALKLTHSKYVANTNPTFNNSINSSKWTLNLTYQNISSNTLWICIFQQLYTRICFSFQILIHINLLKWSLNPWLNTTKQCIILWFDLVRFVFYISGKVVMLVFRKKWKIDGSYLEFYRDVAREKIRKMLIWKLSL